jgi:hypothetical protein
VGSPLKQLKLETLNKIHKAAWEEVKTKTKILYQLAKQEIMKRIDELSDKIENAEKIINHYEKIQKMKSSHDKDIAKIDEQVKSIEQLKRQVPCPPSDDEINQLLKYDLEKLKKECLRKSSVGNRLAEISVFNEEGEEKRVDNPIIFISSGELQEIGKIPLSYKPPLLTFIERASEAFKSTIFSHLDKMPDALKPISKPDMVKHFLARRHTNAKQHNELYFGVYYMEYLMILDDMIILYSFFYDFITGQKVGDRITEIYYEDIVAIEQCREDRIIPLYYDDKNSDDKNSDDKNSIEIPNVPMFRLILPSGNSHSVSFVNRSYFVNLFERLAKKEDSLPKMIDEQTIMANTALADAAINVLRKYLREHKGLVNRS